MRISKDGPKLSENDKKLTFKYQIVNGTERKSTGGKSTKQLQAKTTKAVSADSSQFNNKVTKAIDRKKNMKVLRNNISK